MNSSSLSQATNVDVSVIPNHAEKLPAHQLEAMPTDRQVKQQLEGSQAKVLQLSDAANAFCRFEDSTIGAAFDRRMGKALSADCFFCAPGTQPNRRRECEVGFDSPKPTSGSDCDALRMTTWTNRFNRVHGQHKTLP